MTNHPVPAAIAALLAALRNDPELFAEQVQIDHGPPKQGRAPGRDAIGVGVSAQSFAVGQGNTATSLGGRDEVFDLTCAIDAATGDSDDEALSRVEARAYRLLDVFLGVVEEDTTLGGTVLAATLARHSYRARRENAGTGAYIEATLSLRSSRRRR